MATRVSSYTTLDRFVAEVESLIERADPNADVRALDFRSKSIASRNSGSAGTHSMSGWSDEGRYVRGAADINVYDRRTGRPHKNEWSLLNKYAKPRAIKYGLAYTFPSGPNTYLRSHSGASLHLHADVSIWGTDYGDCYSPYRRGRGGYYRQKHAGRPTAKPPKIGSSASPAKPANGKLAVDGRLGPATIRAWQKWMGTTADGVISKPSSLIKAVQGSLNRQHKTRLKVDGHMGPATVSALQRHFGTRVDGRTSEVSQWVKALQRTLNKGK